MKPVKMLIILITTILAMLGIISCKETIVPADNLPSSAKSIIEEYFPGVPVSYVKKDSKLISTTYEIILQDGTEIELDNDSELKFDKKDQLINIDD